MKPVENILIWEKTLKFYCCAIKGLSTFPEGFSGEADIHVKDADTKDNVCEKLNIRLTQKSTEQMLVSLIWRRKISIAHISSNTFL